MGNETQASRRMKHMLATCLIVVAMVLPGPSRADAAGDMFGFMFRMMLTMMNVMSSVTNNDSGGWGGGSGMNPWSSMGGWPGSSIGLSPWTGMQNPMAYPGSYPFAGSAYSHPYNRNGWYSPRGYPVNTRASLLDGSWYGNTGEVLHIRANRFRLRNGLIVLNGRITLRNNVLTLYTPQTRSVQVYSFARNLTDLVLQDRQGKILTFRKYPGRY